MKYVITVSFTLLGSVPAWAHGALGGGEGILSGLTHFATSPISLASLVGLLAIFYVVQEDRVAGLAVPAAISAGISSFLAGVCPDYLAPLATATLGLAAVFGLPVTNTASFLLALVAGFAGGVAADLDPPSLARAVGVAIAQGTLLGWALYALPALDRVERLRTVLPIARRVLGSWVTAIGLLMAALGFHKTTHALLLG
jgi:hypothetical protein